MSTPYTPTPTALPGSVDLPDDATPPMASELNVPHEAALDGLAYLDPIRVLNFLERRSIPAEPATDEIWDVTYEPATGLWFAVGLATGPTGTVYQGSSWQSLVARTVTSPPGAAFQCVGANSAVVLCPSANSAQVYKGVARSATAIAAVTCTNLGTGTDIIYVPSLGASGRWIVCGEDTSNAPGVWTSDDDGVSWTQRTVPNTNSGQRPVSLAFGGGLLVMCGNHSSGQYWRSSDGITWTEDTQGATQIYCVAYNAARSLWMLGTDEGDFWTSTDADTWTAAASLGFVGTGTPVELRAVGRYFVAYQPSQNSSPIANPEDYLWLSDDAGVSWAEFLPFSNVTHWHSNASVPHRFRATPGGRLVTWGHNSTDGANVAVSHMTEAE